LSRFKQKNVSDVGTCELMWGETHFILLCVGDVTPICMGTESEDTMPENSEMRAHWSRWLWLSFMVIVLDQWTKMVMVQYFDQHSSAVVITSWFNFVIAYNRGAAFSLLADNSELPRILFSVLAIVAAVLIIASLRSQVNRPFASGGLALILGGAMGNLIDRVRIGAVVDFIQWHWADAFYWPAFNVADSAITVGAVCLVIASLQPTGAKT
jgi:signal peptidase II